MRHTVKNILRELNLDADLFPDRLIELIYELDATPAQLANLVITIFNNFKLNSIMVNDKDFRDVMARIDAATSAIAQRLTDLATNPNLPPDVLAGLQAEASKLEAMGKPNDPVGDGTPAPPSVAAPVAGGTDQAHNTPNSLVDPGAGAANSATPGITTNTTTQTDLSQAANTPAAQPGAVVSQSETGGPNAAATGNQSAAGQAAADNTKSTPGGQPPVSGQ